jgi:hypothetical protein
MPLFLLNPRGIRERMRHAHRPIDTRLRRPRQLPLPLMRPIALLTITRLSCFICARRAVDLGCAQERLSTRLGDVFEPFRDNRLIFQGLRKNAVCMFAGRGMHRGEGERGMSPAMVAHYSKNVSQCRPARGAMKHFEEGWTEIRAVGRVKRIG